MEGQPTSGERLWALLAHLLTLLGYAGGVLSFVPPLVIYIIYQPRSPFVAFHALQSLFFQLAILLVAIGLGLLAFVTCGLGLVVALPLMAVVLVGGFILVIVAGILAYQGERYEYPWVGRWAREHIFGRG